METKPLKTIKFPGSDSVYEIHDAVAREDAAKAAKTVNGCAPDTTGDVKLDLEAPAAEAVEKYLAENPPKSEPGKAATLQIIGVDALPAGSTPTVTEQDGSTEQNRVYRIGIPSGKDGADGQPGAPGKGGADGYTPVRGTDYWTTEDQQAIVSDVLAALPTWEGGSY